MMTPFAENIWILPGTDVRVMGFKYPTRMAVIRLQDGSLLLWSPVEFSTDRFAAITALGQVRGIIAPNSLHHLYLPEWIQACPEARVFAAPGLPEKRADIEFSAVLGDQAEPAWAGDVEQVMVRGNKITEEAVFFHTASRTVLFTDLLQQFSRDHFKGWRKWVARFDLMTEPVPAVPRKFRLAFTDRTAARQSLEKILGWPAEHVIMAHGTPVRGGGQAFLKQAFAWLD